MAGDWIKMRGNLWDDPRVSALVDATDSTEAAVVGALYWLWASADQHTENGVMPGLSLRQIDRKTGVAGFGAALCAIGWIVDHPEGIRIVNFEEHNGASAKKRCQTSKRVANHAAANAALTQPALANEDVGVSSALAREELEIEKEKSKKKTRGGEGAVRAASRKCPGDFLVTDEMRTWAALECPTVDVDKAVLKFRDHTFSSARSDWDATLRNWLRKDAEYSTAKLQPVETTYQKSMRLRAAEIAPGLARKAPGEAQNAVEFFRTVEPNILEIAR